MILQYAMEEGCIYWCRFYPTCKRSIHRIETILFLLKKKKKWSRRKKTTRVAELVREKKSGRGEKIEAKKSEHDHSWFRSTTIAIPIIKLQNDAANKRTKSTVTSYINIIEKFVIYFTKAHRQKIHMNQ